VPKNIVVCLDGTNNEPEHGATNVTRFFGIARKDAGQVLYYDPGVGTMGARSATTRFGKWLTRVGGLAFGHGVGTNIEEAYTFLMKSYEPGDRIYVVGFSRGAYTSSALVGMLRTVGLLRPGAENLVPYALKLYAQSGKRNATEEEEQQFWATRSEFDDAFGNPDFPNRFAPQVEFLGLWDTVKSVGWFNLKARFEQAHWPFTHKVPNVRHGRLALALQEKRRYYAPYRFDPEEVKRSDRDLEEVWFTGVHSDVGGVFPDDHRLSDLALHWMVAEAVGCGLEVDAGAYEKALGVALGEPLPDDRARGRVHDNGFAWWIAGLGWRRRRPRGDDRYDASVELRARLMAGGSTPPPTE
jgi:uncharacterized protein (DUF2235 family)